MKQSLSLSHQALVAIRQLKDENAHLRRALNEPIAIVSMALRFPGGVASPETFWKLLIEGRDALTDMPSDRWPLDAYFSDNPDQPGKIYARRGGFLDGMKGFDASLFGLADDEVKAMDPQQRLLVELCWEAMERANMAPDPNPKSKGPRTGVFVGIASSGYARFSMLSGDAHRIGKHSIPGFAPSFASGRLAYLFGLQGPAMSFDTACSSSLVALHTACQALRAGDCDAALVGGANVLVSPEEYVYFCNAAALSPSSRSRPFHAEADGYVRSEGAAVLVLKRLSDAERDGDRIAAVIHGSSVNHDGRSNGLTAPNGEAQRELLASAYTVSGISPKRLGYIEAHGTGTLLGDPIEVTALGNFLRQAGRGPDSPVLIGSVKSNLGHLEAAAGLAGVIKTVLALRHGRIPASLHCDKLNTHIAWQDLPVKVAKTDEPWPGGDQDITDHRFAGVSSFGFSGTNAHVVLGVAPEPAEGIRADVPTPADGATPEFVVGAAEPVALAALLTRMADFCADLEEPDLAHVAFTLATGRAMLSVGVVVQAVSCRDLSDRFRSLADEVANGSAALATQEEMEAARARSSALTARKIQLPGYPFQHRDFWPDAVNTIKQTANPGNSSAAPASRDLPLFDPASDTALSFLQDSVAQLTGRDVSLVSAAPGLAHFELDSITLVRLRFFLQQTFGGEVPLAVLSEGAEWHELIDKLDLSEPISAKPKPDSASVADGPTGKVPMSALQEAYWVGRHSTRDTGACGSYFYIEFEARAITHAQVQTAWNALVARHPMLRASVKDHEIVIAPTRPSYEIACHKAPESDGDAIDRMTRDIRARLSHQVMADGVWPLFRIETLIHDGKLRVFFGIDELIVDGASIVQLLKEWRALAEHGTELAPLSYDFAQYQAFLADRRRDRPDDLEYWERKCGTLPGGPMLARAPGQSDARRKRLKSVLGPAVLSGLEAQARDRKVSLSALVLEVFSRVLGAATDQQTFTLITTYFNRLPVHRDVDRIIGPIAATKLFVWSDSMSCDEVQNQLLSDAEHDSVDGVTLLRTLRRQRRIAPDLTLPVVFTSMIENFDLPDKVAISGNDWHRNWSYVISQTPGVLLDHQIGRRGDTLVLSWDYADGLLDTAAIEALFDSYGAALTALSAPTAIEVARQPEQPGHSEEPIPATAVQRSYAFGHLASGRSCQVYQEICADSFDPGQVERAWQTVMARHAALGFVLDASGTFRPAATASWAMPSSRSFDSANSADFRNLRRTMQVSHRNPMVWPPFDLQLSQMKDGPDIVHVAIDMLVADWPSLQLIYNDLANALAGNSQGAVHPIAATHRRNACAGSGDRSYWAEKLPGLVPARPMIIDTPNPGQMRRLSRRVGNWRMFAAMAQDRGLCENDALAACFARSVFGLTDADRLPLVLVDFKRPQNQAAGDFTRLAWVELESSTRGLEDTAKAIALQREKDWAADPDLGLSLMGRMGPYKSDKSGFALPFVFSRLLQFPQRSLPPGVWFGQGVSSTPGVVLDDVSVLDGDDLIVNWDADLGVLDAELVETCLTEHCATLKSAATDPAFWNEVVNA